MILEMVASGGDRPVVTANGRSLTASDLLARARAAAHRFQGHPAVLYLSPSHLAYPVALFGAALAGVPFIPLNYRLGEHQLARLLARHPGALVLRPADLDALLSAEEGTEAAELAHAQDQDSVAVVLYTSGTTAEPKAALLRHRHLLAYVLNTQEFASAQEADASLVAVPPYHVAGLMNLLTNLYSGRRLVYLPAFDAGEWLATARREQVTHALVVPTMLARIVAEAPDGDAGTPTLRSLAYGGARTPRPVVEQALRIFPGTGFVNAYGLTETASSVAVLGPDDHREALAASDPAVRDRLGSVGRPLPGVEIEIRDDDGRPAAAGETGLVFVRGEQISGEYGGRSALDADGWFPTRDRGRLDADGYLFIEGRADDTIIRGGENIAPAEIEDVLVAHPGIVEAAVIGVPDPEWGQRIVAVVVGAGDPAEVRQWVKDRLRSSKTPDTIVFRAELPKTETGKLLRRTLLAELETTHA
ncbi:long-chain fatty acid--CoA ligase [Streptomyces sp. MBT65]|uniref:class I adenylate-forming enzyme family protein n=1 Tax=Streptomyces sp. MBT65 TaxID=1488395 RepID=UPI00190CE49D|nr:fatty acid--CoA ligase family protein [Streptomyces sp. MBT65]MBK3572333.1 long-chain fatty acid--CoA ligase [Streptomyces sp. MBT65]